MFQIWYRLHELLVQIVKNQFKVNWKKKRLISNSRTVKMLIKISQEKEKQKTGILHLIVLHGENI